VKILIYILDDKFSHLLSCEAANHHKLELNATYMTVPQVYVNQNIWINGVVKNLAILGMPTEPSNCSYLLRGKELSRRVGKPLRVIPVKFIVYM